MRIQTPFEEKLNTITHAIGALFGIAALVLLIAFNTEKTAWSLFSVIIYGISIIVLFMASTFYHAVNGEKRKHYFRIVDHISIYILIAGTYTPFLNLVIGGSSGELYMWAIWGIAIVGTIFKLFFTGSFNKTSLAIYLMMSWLALLLWKSLVSNLSDKGFLYILIGGGFYTLGTVFFMMKKLSYHHFIWHLFVLCGSYFHYLAVRSIFV